MDTGRTKVLLKILDSKSDKVRWIHLCYIPTNLYNKYIYERDMRTTDMNEILSRWCKEDFLVDLHMATSKDVFLLKELVRDFYKRAHPEYVLDSRTDHQGWTRVWITRKMMEELGIYGKESI